MCLSLIPLVLKMRQANIVPAVNVLFMFISAVLLVFLCLACRKSSSSFSQIFTIETRPGVEGAAVVRAGYFYMCEVPLSGSSNSTGTPNCHRNGYFNGTDTAYAFAKHVSRPYFLVIATVFSWLAFLSAIAALLVPNQPSVQQLCYLITVLTALFTLITACWQQIAVHAAVILIPTEVKKGIRAAGMVWSAVCLQILSGLLCMLNHFKANRKTQQQPAISGFGSSGSSGSDSIQSVRSDVKNPFEG